MGTEVELLLDDVDETDSEVWEPDAGASSATGAFFLSSDLALSARNLVNRNLDATIVGAPTAHPGYIDLSGIDGNQKRVETPLVMPSAAGWTAFIAFKLPNPVIDIADQPVLLSTFNGFSQANGARACNGLNLYVSTTSGIMSYAVSSYNGSVASQLTVTLTGASLIDYTRWNLLRLRINGSGTRIKNMSAATAEAVGTWLSGYSYDPNVTPVVIGDSYIAQTSRDGPLSVACAAFFNSYLSDADSDLIAAQLRYRCAAFGIAI